MKKMLSLLAFIFVIPLFAGNFDRDTQNFGTIDGCDRINAFVVQPDKKIVAVGVTTDKAGGSSFVVARYETDGVLDATFNAGGETPGTVRVDFFGAEQAEACAVTLKRDGRIIVVGSAQEVSLLPDDTSQFYAIAVLNNDGSFDTSFAGGLGRAVYSTSAISENSASRANVVAIQVVGEDEYILIAGQVTLSASPVVKSFQVVRIECDGTLDISCAVNDIDFYAFDDTDALVRYVHNNDPVLFGVGVGLRSCISEAIREKYCPSCIDMFCCG